MTTKGFEELLSSKSKQNILGEVFSVPFKDRMTQFIVVNHQSSNNDAPEEEEPCGEFIDVININNENIMINSSVWDNSYHLTDQKIPLVFSRSSLSMILQDLKDELPNYIIDRIVERHDYIKTSIERPIEGGIEGGVNFTCKINSTCIGDIWLPSITEIFGRGYFSDDDSTGRIFPYFKSLDHRINLFDISSLATTDSITTGFRTSTSSNRTMWTRSTLFMNEKASVYFVLLKPLEVKTLDSLDYTVTYDYWNRTTHCCGVPASMRLRID